MERINFLGIPIDNLSMEQTLAKAEDMILQRKQVFQVSVNAAKVVKMKYDPGLYQSVAEADLINADGQAVVWASRLLGQPLKERVAGVDLMQKLVAMASKKGFKIFFFGSTDKVLSDVLQVYREQFGSSVIAGWRNGYYKPGEENAIASTIAQSGCDILFVALPSPAKELFLHNHKETLRNVPFIMGVGGSFDVVGGHVRRAPRWMQNAGLEWFYRLMQEPGRMWKRYLFTNTEFIFLVVQGLLFRKKIPVHPPR